MNQPTKEAKLFPEAHNPLWIFEGNTKSKSICVAENYFRYLTALQYVHHKSVLDVACGVGYGSSLMSMRASKVLAVDISDEIIQYARETFRFYCPTWFFCADLNKTFPIGKFDIITSFETIEHLENYGFFLNNCKNALNDNGVFICSIPPTPVGKHHKVAIRSFTKVKEMFDPYFPDMKWYAQTGMTLENPEFPKLRFWLGIHGGIE